jgi:hypothetical protein
MGTRDAALIQVGADAAERCATEDPNRGFFENRRFGRHDGPAVVLVTVRSVSPTHDPAASTLEIRALLPLDSDVAFMGCEGSPSPRQQAPLTGRQVDVTSHGRECHVMLIAKHDELLELARLAMQPIEPPDHHSVTPAELDVAEESLVRGPWLLCVVRAEIVVNVHLGNVPASPFRLIQTIGLLTLDP